MKFIKDLEHRSLPFGEGEGGWGQFAAPPPSGRKKESGAVE